MKDINKQDIDKSNSLPIVEEKKILKENIHLCLVYGNLKTKSVV